MKIKLLFCFALVLAGATFGCSTPHRAAPGTLTGVPLYLYFGFETGDSAKRCLSTQVYPGEFIFVGGDDFWVLKGSLDEHGTNLFADLIGGTGQEEQYYRGRITPEMPFFAQGGVASGGAGSCWFVVSTNSDSRTVVKQVNAALGFTNAPRNLPPVSASPSLSANFHADIDPDTGLPWGNRSLDPETGLPLIPKSAVPLNPTSTNESNYPLSQAPIYPGIGIESQDIRLPVKFANYHELYTFIAHHTFGSTVSEETIFKLAADSQTEIYSFDDPPPYLWVITPQFFNGGIYDEIRGAQGNGDYYVLRPLARNFTSGNTDCGFELVGMGEGNALRWTSLNGINEFVTSWHISATRHPETVYEWNGKFFEKQK